MNTVLDTLNLNDSTLEFLSGHYGDLYEMVSQEADNAVIYYSDCRKIVEGASCEEEDEATQQMHDTGFVFKDMNDTFMICAYWITHNKLSVQYREELEEDRLKIENEISSREVGVEDIVLRGDALRMHKECIEQLEEAQEKIEDSL